MCFEVQVASASAADTSSPSTLGIFRSSSIDHGQAVGVAGEFAAAVQVIQRLRAVARRRPLRWPGCILPARPAPVPRRVRCPQPAEFVSMEPCSSFRLQLDFLEVKNKTSRLRRLALPPRCVHRGAEMMRRTLARPMPVPSNSSARAVAGKRRTICAHIACRIPRRCRA